MPKSISAANIPINENGRFVDDVNFLGKVNLSGITTKSQYWQDSKQKKQCKKLEDKINNFGKTLLEIKSKTWGDDRRKKLKTKFEKLKNSIISVQKATEISALENQEDVLVTKNLNKKLENIMKEIHKSEGFLAKRKHYKAFDTPPEKKKQELETFRKLDSELKKIEKRSTHLKVKFEKSIEAIRPFKVIQSLIDRFKSLLLSADDELKQRESVFTEISTKIEAQLIEFGEKIDSIENPSLLRSFAYVLKDLDRSLKSAEKLGLLIDPEIDNLKNKITEMAESFDTRMKTLEENAIKKKEEEHKEKITYLQNWKCPGSKAFDSKTAFPYWEHDPRNAIETAIRKYGESLNLETPSEKHSQDQKEVIFNLENILHSVVSVENLSKIENIKQIEISVKLAKELTKVINAIGPYSRVNEIKLERFKKRMLALKKSMKTINNLPTITSKETFDFEHSHISYTPNLYETRSNSYVEENQNTLKKANQHLKKLNKSYEALKGANRNQIIKNPVVLKELESKLALLKSKFQKEKTFEFISKLRQQFKYSDLSDTNRTKLLKLLDKVHLSYRATALKF